MGVAMKKTAARLANAMELTTRNAELEAQVIQLQAKGDKVQELQNEVEQLTELEDKEEELRKLKQQLKEPKKAWRDSQKRDIRTELTKQFSNPIKALEKQVRELSKTSWVQTDPANTGSWGDKAWTKPQ